MLTRRSAPPAAAATAPSSRHEALLDEKAIPATVNRLAFPIILENLFQTALGTVDMLMVSRLGPAAIAGVGTAQQITFLYISALAAITIGTTALVARFTGAGQPDDANRVAKQSITLGIVLSILLGAINLLFAEQIIALLGPETEVVAIGATFLRITAGPAIFFLMMFVAGAILRGAGDSRTPMLVTGLINIVNAALAYVLIFGYLGLPALGVAGSAWATTISRAVGCIILFSMLLRGKVRMSVAGRQGWRPDLGLMRRILRVGVPSMIEQLLFSAGMAAYSVIAIQLGTVVYATQRITFQILGLSFMPGFGYAMAATTLTGQSLGAKRPDLAHRTTWYAVAAAAVWMTSLGVVFFLFGEPLMRLFTDDAEMVVLGAIALQVIAFSQPFQAPGQVLAGSLRGAGDTRFPMVVTSASAWFIRVPFGYLFGIVLGMGLPGMYVSAVLDGAFRAAMAYLRYRTGKWQSIPV